MTARICGIARSLTARPRWLDCLRDTEVGIRLNEHVVGDGPTVFEHACRRGAEGIVSKKVDRTYRSGLCPGLVKVRKPARIVLERERREKANRRLSGQRFR